MPRTLRTELRAGADLDPALPEDVARHRALAEVRAVDPGEIGGIRHPVSRSRQVFGEQIKAATPEYALYGFAIFYVVCLVLNWWYYLGPKAEYHNP